GGGPARRSCARSRRRGGEVPESAVHHGTGRQPRRARRQNGARGGAADSDGAIRRRCRITGELARPSLEPWVAGVGGGRRQGKRRREGPRLLPLSRTPEGGSSASRARPVSRPQGGDPAGFPETARRIGRRYAVRIAQCVR